MALFEKHLDKSTFRKVENHGGLVSQYCMFFLLSIVLYLAYEYLRNCNPEERKRRKWFKEFPGPRPLPILGNGHQMLFKPTEFYKWSWGICKRWGDTALLWRLSFPIIFVCTYETAMDLLSKSNFVEKSKDVDMFWRIPGGNGLASSPTHVHQSRRKLLNPGFSRRVVEQSIYIFGEECSKLVEKMKVHADTGKCFEIVELLMPCTFQIVCRSAFGDDLMARKTDEQALEQMRALHEISQRTTKRIISPYLWKRNDFIYFNLTAEGKTTKEFIKTINDFGREAIAIRQKKRKFEASISAKDEVLGKNKNDKNAPCYLDMLLDLHEKNQLKQSDLLGELNTYIAGGYDATALAIAWTLFALALNPVHHQDKIYHEVKSIFNDSDGNVLTAADTKKMKYLELVIKETFRLFPTSPLLPRSTIDDMTLRDGRVIPSGTDVFIMIDMIHRDPKYFPEPEKFLPERHLQPNPAFLPFATGGRACIGQVYAMHLMKVVLAYLLKDFVWTTEDKEETLPRLFQALMVPAQGIRMKITKRPK